MLPSKGYFKFLNCPFFDSCFCNRPHCHFRHSRKDKYGNEIEISDDMDFENLKNETDDNPFSGCTPEMLEELSKNFVEPGQSSGPITYKPTPIAELKKRHIPVTAAPSASTSQESSRKIDNVRKSKAEYCPGSEQSSHTPPTYKATKISKSPKKSNDDRELILNTSVLEGDKVGSISPKTDNIVEDIDLEQLSKTLDFIDEFLYDSDNKPQNTVISDKSSSGNTDNKRNSGKSPSENILVNLNDDSLNKIEKNKPPAKTNHEHLRVSKSEKKTSSHKENQERHGSKRETSLESKGSKSSEHKKSSLKRSSKHLDPHEDNKLPAKTNKYSDHEHLRVSKSEKKTSSHKENQERHGSKRETSLESKEYKSSEHKKGSLKRSSKHLDPHENNIPPIKTKKYSDHEHLSEATEDISNLNKNKHIKKENDKQGDKSSKKSSSHKHSSRSSSKKDENVKNSSSKSSNKQSEHKTSSASDHKVSQQITHSSKTSTHKSVDSKTEPLSHHEHHKSTKSKSSSSDNFSTSSKHKEKKHKKESHDKRKISETHRKTHKDDKRKDESKNKSRRVEAAIRLDDEDDDDVEFVSELKPVIVLDSEEESTNEEIKKVKNKNKFEREERKSVSPSFDYSPTLPSGDSSSESEDNNEVTVAPSVSTVKIVDDLAKLDNRVMQRMKNRVSLGNTWRPPTKKPVHMMKPAERMAMFRKRLIDIDEQYDPEAPAQVRIGYVPNVKLLLKEKERLLRMASKPEEGMASLSLSSGPENEDRPPKVKSSVHPKNCGASLDKRQDGVNMLYKVARQLVKPGDLYESAKIKCLRTEEEIWRRSKHSCYEQEIKEQLKKWTNEISQFTTTYYRELCIPRKECMYYKVVNKKMPNGRGTEEIVKLYDGLKNYLLTPEQLQSEGYPRQKMDPRRNDVAYIDPISLERYRKPEPVVFMTRDQRMCDKCGKCYYVDDNGLSMDINTCSYHRKKTFFYESSKGQRVKFHSCCGGKPENPCMFSKYHSTETKDISHLVGYVQTKDPVYPEPMEGWGVFALDCEMYWSVEGLELGRVTVVNAEERIVYDTLVKPERTVTDYCTSLSGLTEENLSSATLTLAEVQNTMLELFNSKTILIGHSLESDLKALKIIHSTVVDTSVVFKRENNKKWSLKQLAIDNLNENIQNEEDGHDSAEDAVTCIKLMKQLLLKNHPKRERRAPEIRIRYKEKTYSLE